MVLFAVLGVRALVVARVVRRVVRRVRFILLVRFLIIVIFLLEWSSWIWDV